MHPRPTRRCSTPSAEFLRISARPRGIRPLAGPARTPPIQQSREPGSSLRETRPETDRPRCAWYLKKVRNASHVFSGLPPTPRHKEIPATARS